MIIAFLCIVLFGWTILIEITTRSARCTSKLKKKKHRGERWFFVLSRARDKEKIMSPHEESNLNRSDLPFIRLIFFPILYTKHDAIDIADPSCMQDACHI